MQLQAPYVVATTTDDRIARLRQTLDDLARMRQDVEILLGNTAIIDQAERAAKEAARLYTDAHAAAMLGDHRDATRRLEQAALAQQTVVGCLAWLAEEGGYDG